MAKAFAFIQNTNSQTITGGGVANPGTAQHGFGCYNGCKTIRVSGNNINLRECGYYEVVIGATVSATTAGSVTMALYQDGALLAQSSGTIAAANNPANISFPAGVKVGCSSSSLTVVMSATAGDPILVNSQITVDKE